MRRIAALCLLVTVCCSTACKKLVEDQKRDLLIQAITAGQWHVEDFQEGPTSATPAFSGYSFQFHENGTVSGIKEAQRIEGTWSGDLRNYSISSTFPEDADPLRKLNGTWLITDSEANFVAAEMTSTIGKNILHLRKNL